VPDSSRSRIVTSNLYEWPKEEAAKEGAKWLDHGVNG
jgi:hypothetical protein